MTTFGIQYGADDAASDCVCSTAAGAAVVSSCKVVAAVIVATASGGCSAHGTVVVATLSSPLSVSAEPAPASGGSDLVAFASSVCSPSRSAVSANELTSRHRGTVYGVPWHWTGREHLLNAIRLTSRVRYSVGYEVVSFPLLCEVHLIFAAWPRSPHAARLATVLFHLTSYSGRVYEEGRVLI